MLIRILLLALILVSDISFAFEYCEEDSDCDAWEKCDFNYICTPFDGRCNGDGDCFLYESCDVSSHYCTLGEGYCETDSNCEEWESCSGYPRYVCELRRGACITDDDCRYFQICNTDAHNCMDKTEYCEVYMDCEDWESCNGLACKPISGRCNSDDDCRMGEICDSSLHECMEDTGASQSTEQGCKCEDWEECSIYGACELRSGACITDHDCQSSQICNTDAHNCMDKTEYCEVYMDCEDWESCNGLACKPISGRCNSDDDCPGSKVCDFSVHACSSDVVSQECEGAIGYAASPSQNQGETPAGNASSTTQAVAGDACAPAFVFLALALMAAGTRP